MERMKDHEPARSDPWRKHRIIPAPPGWWALSSDEDPRAVIAWIVRRDSEDEECWGHPLVLDPDGLVVEAARQEFDIVGPPVPPDLAR